MWRHKECKCYTAFNDLHMADMWVILNGTFLEIEDDMALSLQKGYFESVIPLSNISGLMT